MDGPRYKKALPWILGGTALGWLVVAPAAGWINSRLHRPDGETKAYVRDMGQWWLGQTSTGELPNKYGLDIAIHTSEEDFHSITRPPDSLLAAHSLLVNAALGLTTADNNVWRFGMAVGLAAAFCDPSDIDDLTVELVGAEMVAAQVWRVSGEQCGDYPRWSGNRSPNPPYQLLDDFGSRYQWWCSDSDVDGQRAAEYGVSRVSLRYACDARYYFQRIVEYATAYWAEEVLAACTGTKTGELSVVRAISSCK